jgi:hypothetical protein
MKLETSITPRLDGTVIVHGLDNKEHVFKTDPDTGLVVCDVAHEGTVVHLLRQGTFFPADEADHAHAEQLVAGSGGGDAAQAGADDGGDEGDDLGDDPVDLNALPLEANTLPAAPPVATAVATPVTNPVANPVATAATAKAVGKGGKGGRA